MGATPRGQQGTPALTLLHMRDGLRVLLTAVLWMFSRPSLCRAVHCQLLRNELLDLTTIVPATDCHQRNYVEAYSRYMRTIISSPPAGVSFNAGAAPQHLLMPLRTAAAVQGV